jgi:hypothetical protein
VVQPGLRYEKDGSWAAALADLRLGATLAPDDEDIATASEACRLHLAAI